MVEREYPLDSGRVAHVAFTGRNEGDLAVSLPTDELAARRRTLVDRPWVWLEQVHGPAVVVVDEGALPAGAPADALVTGRHDCVLAIHTADCPPVALMAAEDIVGLVHAGWRGLLAGVLESTVDAMRTLGATEVRAALGPCIHPECYEFGEGDLARVADRYGPTAIGSTREGTPALDLPAVVRAALDGVHVKLDFDVDRCTACDQSYFSHRASGDTARQATIAWITP